MKNITVGKVLITIATVILTLSLVFFIATGVSEMRDVDYTSRYLTEEYYVTTLQQENYVELLSMTARDSKLGETHSETIKSCKAVAHYFEAASLYKAYVTVNNTKAAGVQIQRMEQYATQTGEFEAYVDKVNNYLELDSIA